MSAASLPYEPVVAHTPRFSADGAELAFISNLGATAPRTLHGAAQVWQIPLHRGRVAGFSQQLTFASHGLDDALFAPCDFSRAVCARDPSRDGRTQLYLAAADGAETPLTIGFARCVHTPGAWMPDGRAFLFAANRRREDRLDLYLQAVPLPCAPDGTPPSSGVTGQGECRLVWQNGAPGFLGWMRPSPDGARAVVIRFPDNRTDALYEVDLAVGAMHALPLQEPEQGVRVRCPTYMPDGRSLLILTDREAEHLYLAGLSLENDAGIENGVEPLAAPPWDVESFALSPDGRRVAAAVNEGGLSRLYLYDLEGRRRRPTRGELPPGVISDLAFAPDGGQLAFTFASAAEPGAIFIWDLVGGDPRPIVSFRQAERAVEPELIHYPTFDGLRIPAWLYASGAPSPSSAVVHVHGGPEAQARPTFDPLIQALVRAGHAVLVPNVRGSTGYGRSYEGLDDGPRRMDAVADLAHAAHWLRDQAGVDPERIGIYGHSYGGFLALAALAHHPGLWAAGVASAAMSHLGTYLGRHAAHYRPYRSAEYGDPEQLRDFFDRTAPLRHAARIRAPVLIVHGARDARVSIAEAEQIVAALTACGAAVEYLRFEDEGHEIRAPENRRRMHERIVNQFDRLLRAPSAVQVGAGGADAQRALSDGELRGIVARASTLAERLGTDFESCPGQEDVAQSRLDRWRAIVSPGDCAQLDVRLAWDGWTPDQALAGLGAVRLREDRPLPEWAQMLRAIVEHAGDGAPRDEERLGGASYGALLAPCVALARSRLAVRAGAAYHLLAPAAHAALETALKRSLAGLCAPTLDLRLSLLRARRLPGVQIAKPPAREAKPPVRTDGRTTWGVAPLRWNGPLSEARRGGAVQDEVSELLAIGLPALLREYPALARLVAEQVGFWIDAQAEMLARLAADWDELHARFGLDERPLGQVIAVAPGLSDPHRCGRRVAVLEFAGGLRLVYKPRSLALEAVYFDLLVWLNRRLADEASDAQVDDGRPQGAAPAHGGPSAPGGGRQSIHRRPLAPGGGRPSTGGFPPPGAAPTGDGLTGAAQPVPRVHRAAPTGDGLTPFRTLAVLDRRTHGWMAHAAHAPCLDEGGVGRFYRRAGMLLALVYALAGADCHGENLIACGDQPVLVDLEMLAAPEVRGVGGAVTDADRLIERRLRHSVLSTGFLSDGEWWGISALTLRAEGDAPHLPMLHGRPVPASAHVEDICAGFEAMGRLLLRHRQALLAADGPLAALEGKPVRVICRNTSAYASLLRSSLQPRLLREGVERSLHLEVLARAHLSRADEREPAAGLSGAAMLRAEREALERADIPHLAVTLPRHACTQAAAPGETQVAGDPLERLHGLSEADLAYQVGLTRSVLASPSAVGSGAGALEEIHPEDFERVHDVDAARWLTAARAIAEALQRGACRGDAVAPTSDDGGATWLFVQDYGLQGRAKLRVCGCDLYSGRTGIALFLAALARATQEARFRDLAGAALRGVCQALDDPAGCERLADVHGIGGVVGLGSLVYALTRMSCEMEDPALLALAGRAAALITVERIRADEQLDVMGGAAGAILGLLALHRATGEESLLPRVRECAEHLLRRRIVAETGHRVWRTAGAARPLTGFSHGMAGMAYALLRAWAATGDERAYAAAREALAFERELFDAKAGNWRDWRQEVQPAFASGWCHGAPGIALARLASLDLLDAADAGAARAEAAIALRTMERSDPGKNLDHLCCGNFGLIDIWIEASKRMDPGRLSTARCWASAVTARADRLGGFVLFSGGELGFPNPGFFRGMAGIGYALLRLAQPGATPCVLLLDQDGSDPCIRPSAC